MRAAAFPPGCALQFTLCDVKMQRHVRDTQRPGYGSQTPACHLQTRPGCCMGANVLGSTRLEDFMTPDAVRTVGTHVEVVQYLFVRGHCEGMTHFLLGLCPLFCSSRGAQKYCKWHRSVDVIDPPAVRMAACFIIFKQLCDHLQPVFLLSTLSEVLMHQFLQHSPCLHADICTPVQPTNGAPGLAGVCRHECLFSCGPAA